MSKKNSIYLVLCVFIMLPACSNNKQTTDNTMHEPDSINPQSELYIFPGLDHGLVQSPINIYSFTEEKNNKHKITLHFQDNINTIENLGHTVQLDFSEGSTISYEELTYAFNQIHFHTPSEHLIDGMTFPMEMHIVTSIPAGDENDVPHYLVIGILFKMGQTNKFIDEFLKLIPKDVHAKTVLKTGQVKLHDLFSIDDQFTTNNFYHYQGSLTTPPYTESVKWFVFKHILEASPEQIEMISAIEGNNARHIQGIFGRSIN